MGKNKSKNGEAPNPTSVTNRDVLQRLNFLYQASVLLNGLAPPDAVDRDDDPLPVTRSDDNAGTAKEHPPRVSQKKRKQNRRVVGLGELSRSYVETMKSVGRKTNVRMDPSVKRCICKHCCAPLIPGISATVRIQGEWAHHRRRASRHRQPGPWHADTCHTDSASHGHLIAYRCLRCRMERRIPAPSILHTDLPTSEDVTEARGGVQKDATSLTPPPVADTSTGNVARAGPRRQRKKGPQPRLPPHFARDVGHVVFRGNELLDAVLDIP